MKKISLFSLLFASLFISHLEIVGAKEPSLPYRTIEEAIRASGGTYGVIDTSNPDAANNFVQTVFDQGLTGSDGSKACTSMNIRTGIKIACALSVNNDAYYYYEGQKGESIKVSLNTGADGLSLSILDANNNELSSNNKAIINNGTDGRYIGITKILPYSGKYTFQVLARGYEKREGTTFTIGLTSDRSNVQTDLRKDVFVEGQKYTAHDLQSNNQSSVSRKFIVDADVVKIYKEPYCSKDAYSCPISQGPNITITDGNIMDTTVLWLLGADEKYNFEIGKRYEFEVSVHNTSNTNIPQNRFEMISFKEITHDTTVVPINSSGSNQSSRTSIFARITDWFRGLFQ